MHDVCRSKPKRAGPRQAQFCVSDSMPCSTQSISIQPSITASVRPTTARLIGREYTHQLAALPQRACGTAAQLRSVPRSFVGAPQQPHSARRPCLDLSEAARASARHGERLRGQGRRQRLPGRALHAGQRAGGGAVAARGVQRPSPSIFAARSLAIRAPARSSPAGRRHAHLLDLPGRPRPRQPAHAPLQVPLHGRAQSVRVYQRAASRFALAARSRSPQPPPAGAWRAGSCRARAHGEPSAETCHLLLRDAPTPQASPPDRATPTTPDPYVSLHTAAAAAISAPQARALLRLLQLRAAGLEGRADALPRRHRAGRDERQL